MDGITYLNADWTTVVDGLEGLVDLVVCDPVYDDLDLGYVEMVAEVLRPGGSVYVFGDCSGVAETKFALDATGLRFLNWCIWPNDWGGRSRTRYGQKHDDILLYCKPGADHHFDAAAVQIPKRMTGATFNPSGRQTKIPASVWSDLAGFATTASERVRIDGRAVRWQKPMKLVERIVRASSRPGDLVLDPFGGVATVPVVCHSLDRRCVSTEIDPAVHAAGLERLSAVLG